MRKPTLLAQINSKMARTQVEPFDAESGKEPGQVMGSLDCPSHKVDIGTITGGPPHLASRNFRHLELKLVLPDEGAVSDSNWTKVYIINANAALQEISRNTGAQKYKQPCGE